MTDFLLELRCEEIPARMQAGARADLEKLFRKELGDAGVTVGEVTVWSTPRRLALIARGLPQATESVREETKGPRVGAPPQALEGFLRKSGLTQDQLEERDGVLFAVIEKPGRAVGEVLAEAIPNIVRAFAWPKSMRWGATSLSTDSPRWVRPLSGIVATFGNELVPCQVGDIASGYMTLGHRFHHPGPITIGGADDYQEKLRACHVIVDHEEREAMIRAGAAKAAADAKLALVEDEGLVIENAGLTEWPVPLLGRFDPAFLDVPPEVIQLTARTNQKYFVCEKGGKLADAFVCTANIDSSDPAAVIDGNRKVLAARLADARFFWDQDRKTPLAEHAKKLKRITFHEKLGTVADKVERVAKLARWLVEEGIVPPTRVPAKAGTSGGAAPDGTRPLPSQGLTKEELADPTQLADWAEQAARLAKADLVTEMVGEFPELQGLMGGYYARAEGLPDEVADAIRDHYKPVGQGDEVPTAPVTVAVSLADKLDNLFGFFAIGEKPTGSKDPFVLRRASLGIIATIIENRLAVEARFAFTEIAAVFVQRLERQHLQHLPEVLDAAKKAQLHGLPDLMVSAARTIWAAHEKFSKEQVSKARYLAAEVFLFLVDRLKVQQREAGVRHDLIDAVFALGGEDDLVRLLARVQALQSFVGTEDGANLLAGYKRAANILKKEDWQGGAQKRLTYTPEPAEKALIDALDAAEPEATAAVEAEDFESAMAALASLRTPIDRFFDEVTVNDANSDKRTVRLDLLSRFRDAVHKVADFSRIEA